MKLLSLALALALALVGAGCLGNLAKEADETDAAATEALEQAALAMDQTAAGMEAAAKASASGSTNASTAPPVARITAFGAGGALVYKSTFQADDPKEIVVVAEKSTVKLIAADSEAIAPGATIRTYAWTLDGKPLGTANNANAEVGEAGKYVVVLTVTDSNGKSDAQTLTLGVPPKPFDVATEMTSEPVVGAEEQGQAASLTYTLALADAKVPATVQAIQFVATPPVTCDIKLVVKDPVGETVGSVDAGGNGADEKVAAGAVPEGAYAIELVPITPCVAHEGIAVVVTVTFLPTIEGLSGADGHGHAH